MGSFDMACSISGISLGYQQPTKMFFIICDGYKEDRISSCYPTDFWRFCSFGIDMKYDDYGRYEFDTNQPEWKVFIDFIKERSLKIKSWENPYHELEFDSDKPEHLEPDYLFDIMYHGRLELKPYWQNGTKLLISPFPIHRGIFEKVCLKPYKSWRNEVITIPFLIDSLKKNIEEREKENEIRYKDFKDQQLKDGKITHEQYEKMMKILWKEYRAETFHLDESFFKVYHFSQIVEKYGLDLVIKSAAEIRMLWNTLYCNRIMVGPRMSAGQERDHDRVLDFHLGCAEVIKNIWEEEKREFGDYEDEEQLCLKLKN